MRNYEAFALLLPVSRSKSGYHLYAQQHLAARKATSCRDLQSEVSGSIFIATGTCNVCVNPHVSRCLAHIEPPPRVIEWEMRYIFHFIRQGAPLLNTEAHDERLRECTASFPLDFLTTPFGTLVQAGFFRSNHIEAFIDKWYS